MRTQLFINVMLLGFVFFCGALFSACSRNRPEAISSKRSSEFQNRKADSDMAEKVVKTDKEWRELLTPEQYRITRKKGTERAFTGKYHDFKGEGTYTCVCCGNELFSSETKFDSGTGWPSFWEAISPDKISTEIDRSFFMRRIEALCSRCDAHLGHVFEDGPAPTGLRYCMNSAALQFVEKKNQQASH